MKLTFKKRQRPDNVQKIENIKQDIVVKGEINFSLQLLIDDLIKKNNDENNEINEIDNSDKQNYIKRPKNLHVSHIHIARYLHMMASNKFIYKINGESYKLYSYNGKHWETNDLIIRRYISNELYGSLTKILLEKYWNTKEFNMLKKEIDKLNNNTYKMNIIKAYQEVGTNNQIVFDDNWKLFGFGNLVYDMENECFREYQYDDYISQTTGYDWREPTDEEMETMEYLIKTIMPIEEERNVYLQILSTAIDGRCPEKFIIFNGNGGNGKGMIDDMLLVALGNYGLIGNNAILFETSKTGSNPEKANIHKKRLVIFREPPERNKFENSLIKELTGGGNFSARTHYETNTEKKLNATIIIECNKKPLFAEDPTEADSRRIIDLYFRSTFTEDKTLIDPEKYIFAANPLYKTSEFQQKHKFALLKILMREHVKYYKHNNSIFIIPSSIKTRTDNYMELSCSILQWFKDNYELTNNKKDICKIKDIFSDFSISSHYVNLKKMEKRKYNKTFFTEYFEANIYLKKYFYIANNTYFIHSWKKNDNIDDDVNIFDQS